MTKHTPGPWRVDPTNASQIRCSDDDGDIVIAAAFNMITAKELADARLIAAAPDMLAALHEALDVMGEWGEDGDPAWAERARAAIARAEGREG